LGETKVETKVETKMKINDTSKTADKIVPKKNGKELLAQKKAEREAAQANGTYTSLKDKRQQAKNDAEQKMVAEPPVDEGINIKQNELAEEQKAISEMNAPTDDFVDAQDGLAQLGMDSNTISNALSGDTNAQKSVENGLDAGLAQMAERTNDGLYKPMSKWDYADNAEKIGYVASAISLVLFALSGGTIAPINFSKLTDLDNKYQAYCKQIDQANTLISGAQGQNKAEEVRAGQDVQTAEKAATIDNTAQAQLMRLASNLDTASKKELMDAAYSQDVHKMSDTLDALLAKGFDREQITQIASLFASQMGITPSQLAAQTAGRWTQVFTEPVKTLGEGVGNAVKAATPSDESVKAYFTKLLKF